jgi:hypothetical protein
MEMLLNLTPMDLLIMAEARMVLYRLANLNTEAGLLSIWKNVSDPILDMRSDHTIPGYNYTKFFNIRIDPDYWRNEDPTFPEDALIWYTDGSKTDSGTGSGIYGLRPNRSLCFSLGEYATVFQTEIYAILQCAYENIRRAYTDKRILILSDRQAALTAIGRPKVTSRLVSECLDALQVLADLNEVNLIWVPCTRASWEMNRLTNLLDKRQQCTHSVQNRLLEYLSVWQRDAIKNWTEHQHLSIWKVKPGCRHGKLFIGKSSKERAEDLLKLGRLQLKRQWQFSLDMHL